MKLFISHATKDDLIVTRIYESLKVAGIDVWADHHNMLPPIANYREALHEALRTCDAGLLVLSRNSVRREEIDSEWNYILATQRPLYAAKIDDVPIEDVNPRLLLVQWVDLSRDWEQRINALAEYIHGNGESIIRTASPTTVLPPRTQPKIQDRNRERLLQKVRTYWVEGVLEKSLYAEARLQLGMEVKPDAVENPWDTVLQHLQYGDYKLPAGTAIIDVFQAMNGELLILGEPGSGKTTTLLELARDLIDRAVADETQLIPVVFNLSSWAQERNALSEWFVNELNTKYQVPKKTGKAWVENDQLILLLDGLDEVNANYRNVCVGAINSFRNEHTVDLVVCSRITDYEALETQLRLQGALVLQALTLAQVDTFLAKLGDGMQGVRFALGSEPTFQELMKNPLMVSIAVLAYRGREINDLMIHRQMTAAELTNRLFETYVQRMFERKGKRELYPREQTINWLVWMAQKMRWQEQIIFSIEGMDSGWLAGLFQEWIYRFGVAFVIAALSIPITRQVFDYIDLQIPIAEPFYFSLMVIIISLFFAEFERVTELSLWAVFIVTSVATFLLFLLIYLAPPLVLILVGVIIVSGLLNILFPWVKEVHDIRAVNNLSWSTARGVAGLKTGIVLGLGWLVPGLTIITLERVSIWNAVLVETVILGLYFLIGAAVNRDSVIDSEQSVIPNQSIWRSLRNALLGSIAAGMILAVFAGFMNALYNGTFWQAAVVGFGFGWLIGFLNFGGRAVIKHFIIRVIFWRSGSIPWNYAQFLDYCAERVFLRKVGGGYIFIHRLLMEYFAGRFRETNKR